jgi:hypothetical protein
MPDDDLELCELRGALIEAGQAITRDREVWLVPVPTPFEPERRCRVVLGDRLSCTCFRYTETGQPCEHVFAAQRALARTLGRTPAAPVCPDEVPPGAPDFVTPELMRETYRVWQAYYPTQLTDLEVLAIIVHVAQFTEFV